MATLQLSIPDIETQQQIVSQIEKEQELVNANKQLIQIFPTKNKRRNSKGLGKIILNKS